MNDLRDRVREWRAAGWAGTTSITQELFEFWFDDDRRASNTRPFFCQQEAVETIAFLTEAPGHLLVGIDVPGSGEAYTRWAVKMATGTGKTLVMAMLIAWSGLNRVTDRHDSLFTDQILVMCPNLTVRDRLSGIGGLDPRDPASAFSEFDLIPPRLSGLWARSRSRSCNWQMLAPREDPKGPS